jgi:hypothetical protein
MVSNEQVACLVDKTKLGEAGCKDMKVRSYKHARPARKVETRKEEVNMQIVADFWTENLLSGNCQERVTSFWRSSMHGVVEISGWVLIQ